LNKCSKSAAIVVIDKTQHAYLSKKLMAPRQKIDNLIVVRRSHEEELYDSLSTINLDIGLWAFQLHDDDSWEGCLYSELSWDESEVIVPRIAIRNGSTICEVNYFDETKPALTNFLLIPGAIWNSFGENVKNRQGEAPGYMHSVLTLLCRKYGKIRYLNSFLYVYDVHNWQKTKNSEILEISSARDGWADLASVETEIISRNVELFVAERYFSTRLNGLLREEPRHTYALSTLPYFRIIHLKLRVIIQILLSFYVLLRLLFQNNEKTRGKYSRIKEQIMATNLIIRFAKVDSAKGLVSQIKELLVSEVWKVPSIRLRFWLGVLDKERELL
jgi:hypothetical protein